MIICAGAKLIASFLVETLGVLNLIQVIILISWLTSCMCETEFVT